MQRDQDQQDGKTEVTMEPKTASSLEPFSGEDRFCQDKLYQLSPFKLAVVGSLPAQYLGRGPGPLEIGLATTVEASKPELIKPSPTQVHQAQEHLNLRRLFFPMYCSSSAQEAIHHHTLE